MQVVCRTAYKNQHIVCSIKYIALKTKQTKQTDNQSCVCRIAY